MDAVRHHVSELTHGAAFKGSSRSQQFLRYIVEKTLEGEIHSLKERTIGVELFQRSPTYDTGQDAIVRVTASDVRRRLQEHYGRYGDTSDFHILLPRGSYVPEIEALRGVTSQPRPEAEAQLAETAEASAVPATNESVDSPEENAPARKQGRRWLVVAIGIAACLVFALAGMALRRSTLVRSEATLPPWKAILRPGHATQIITSDPNVEELQELTGHNLSISDYANHRFIPDGVVLTADQQEFYRFYQHADNAAAIDTPLAVSMARLASRSFPIQIHSARSLHITDLENDDSFILIGSPRSNPWVNLFQDQLDFRFVFDPELKQEIVENVHPLGHEQARYLPTARGFATGESYALVALVHNQNRSGHVLLLAGLSGEGTEAAGHMVTDREHLVRLLHYCGLSASGPIQDFELLVQLRMLAGSPSITHMAACHLLPSHN